MRKPVPSRIKSTPTSAPVAVLEPEKPDVVDEPGDGLTAAVTAEDGTVLPAAWHAYLVVEGLRTTDNRMFAPDSLSWRELPLALEWNPDGNDHYSAGIVGSITSIERQDGGYIYAEGTFDLGSDIGREAARLCTLSMLRWVSIDAEVLESELVEIGAPDMDDDWFFFWKSHDVATFDQGYDWYESYLSARIAGAHMVTIPAFPQAIIVPSDADLEKVEPMGDAPQVNEGLMACAALSAPPEAWFRSPELDEPTPVSVLASGRVYGHLATWGTCHIGFEDVCVCPPKSAKSYAYATTGRLVTAEGTSVPVGHLTMGTGHAPLQSTSHAAASHYDDTGTVVADVTFGEDNVGIWFAGSLRPGVTDDQVTALRASAISGDWRSIGGNLELVAALCVNVPGFPVVASGRGTGWLDATVEGPRAGLRGLPDNRREQVSLVAAGITKHDPSRPMREAVVELGRKVEALNALIKPLIASALTARGL